MSRPINFPAIAVGLLINVPLLHGGIRGSQLGSFHSKMVHTLEIGIPCVEWIRLVGVDRWVSIEQLEWCVCRTGYGWDLYPGDQGACCAIVFFHFPLSLVVPRSRRKSDINPWALATWPPLATVLKEAGSVTFTSTVKLDCVLATLVWSIVICRWHAFPDGVLLASPSLSLSL